MIKRRKTPLDMLIDALNTLQCVPAFTEEPAWQREIDNAMERLDYVITKMEADRDDRIEHPERYSK